MTACTSPLESFEVDALQDLLAVDLGAETLDDEVSHVRAFPESGPPRAARETDPAAPKVRLTRAE